MNFYQFYMLLESYEPRHVRWAIKRDMPDLTRLSGLPEQKITALMSLRNGIGMVCEDDEQKIHGFMIILMEDLNCNIPYFFAEDKSSTKTMMEKLIERLKRNPTKESFYIKFNFDQIKMYGSVLKELGLETRLEGDEIIAFMKKPNFKKPQSLFNQPEQTKEEPESEDNDPYGLFKNLPYGK